MIHIDLFSGIGGFALAIDEVFGKSEHIFCEIDPYCQALLKKRFPGSVIFGDIKKLTFDLEGGKIITWGNNGTNNTANSPENTGEIITTATKKNVLPTTKHTQRIKERQKEVSLFHDMVGSVPAVENQHESSS